MTIYCSLGEQMRLVSKSHQPQTLTSSVNRALTFTFTFLHLEKVFIQSGLSSFQGKLFISSCTPWELNP